VTVSEIVTRAGVSRRTFYEMFADRDYCLGATFEDALARAAARVLPVYEAHERWRDRIRAALEELLAFFDEEPAVARLLIVESLAGRRALIARRAQLVGRISEAVQAGGSQASSGKRPRSVLTGEGVVGAVLAVLHARLCGTSRQPLSVLASQLTSVIVLPYLGAAAAQRELLRPAPEPPAKRVPDGAVGPLKALPMRLTYRTMRVLEAIAQRPGCSNREVAGAAGITDQGQVSKLLRRLERLGLIVNDSANDSLRTANAWRHTAKGEQFQAVVDGGTAAARDGRRRLAAPSGVR
jgi:AcrR family transcriptional regulator